MSIMNYLLGGFDGVEEIPELTPGKKNPLDILKELGYTHELHEAGKCDHFVRYETPTAKNPYFIPTTSTLIIEKQVVHGREVVVSTYIVNKDVRWRTMAYQGYGRAKNLAIRSVISNHHISHKKNTREGK